MLLSGFRELWRKKTVIFPKLVVNFENISKDGILLLNKMFFSVGLKLNQSEIFYAGNFESLDLSTNFLQQAIFISNCDHQEMNIEKFILCPHPDEILKKWELKKMLGRLWSN